MMIKHASLCVLGYKRPQQLLQTLESIRLTADYPYTLIVNADGGDQSTLSQLYGQFAMGKLSHLIFTGGGNRGVGRSFQNCLGVAEGDYIFKVDADLTFKEGWLSTSIKILDENPDIGAVSLFDYNHYDPNDARFTPKNNHIKVAEDHIIVKDFVSSVYGFRKLTFLQDMPDDGFHQDLAPLAITKEDLVVNHGFGIGRSVYISGTEEAPFKTPTHPEPLIFLQGRV